MAKFYIVKIGVEKNSEKVVKAIFEAEDEVEQKALDSALDSAHSAHSTMKSGFVKVIDEDGNDKYRDTIKRYVEPPIVPEAETEEEG